MKFSSQRRVKNNPINLSPMKEIFRSRLFVWTLLFISTTLNAYGWIYMLSHSITLRNTIYRSLHHQYEITRPTLLAAAYIPILICLLFGAILITIYWKRAKKEGRLDTILLGLFSICVILLPFFSSPEWQLAVGHMDNVLCISISMLLILLSSAFIIYRNRKRQTPEQMDQSDRQN